MVKFGPVPSEIRPVAHLLKIAEDHEDKNIVITYWALMGACQLALKLVPNQKSKQTADLLGNILAWLEETKKLNAGNDGITNVTTAQAMVEEYALKVLSIAENLDQSEVYDKNTVKMYYTAGLVMDMLEQFDALDDEFNRKRKYAKWKAAHIHQCLKTGEKPIPGPKPDFQHNDPGIVHVDQIDKDDLKNYTIYKDVNKPPEPPTVTYSDSTGSESDDLLPGQSSASPITPVIPTNPTPFNTPVPQVTPTVSPPATPYVNSAPQPATSGSFVANPEAVQKAQKYCKYAASALNYDDVKNAVEYLNKALSLLNTGTEEP